MIPFTPYNDEFREPWNAAYEIWKKKLNQLMQTMDDSEFLELWTPSLFEFSQQVWDAHLDGEAVDVFLLKSLFQIYLRRSYLVCAVAPPVSLWVLFTVVYAKSNPGEVREALQGYDMNSTAQALISTLNELVLESEMTERMVRVIHVLTRALDALMIVKPVTDLETLVPGWHERLTTRLYVLVQEQPDLAMTAYEIKQALVSLWSSATETVFFRKLGYACHPFQKMGEPTDRDGAVEYLGQWIETSEIRPASALVDAPLIMDWEHVCAISQKLDTINSQCYQGQDEMLQILQMQMEQVRDTLVYRESWEVPEIPDETRDIVLNQIENPHAYSESYLLQLFKECGYRLDQLQQRITPHKSLLANRQNVYDNDAFDVFSDPTRLDPTLVYHGKKEKGDASLMLNDHAVDKQKVLGRVKDMYEDEEAEELESSMVQDGSKSADPGIQHESYLVHLFASTPSVLSRNANARKSSQRAEIKQHTGMSDEQIEGWAIMFGRNPRKQRILDKYMLFDGTQSQLPKKTPQTASQTTPKKSTPKDRSSKEKNKAKVGNHNRKNMRDKKLSKAGPPPS